MNHEHQEESKDDIYQHALQLCRDKGLRLTGLRKKILKMIIHASEPLSAYALIAVFKEDGIRMTATTVYRTLDFLEQHGMVHRLASRNAYVSCVTPGHTLHGQFWICQECHTVSELHIDSVSQAITSCAISQKFQVLREVVEVWGICESCSMNVCIKTSP